MARTLFRGSDFHMETRRRKADLAQAVLEGGTTKSLSFDESDVAELFAPL